MKRLILFLIPIVLVFIIVFGILRVFILPDTGKGALQVTSQPLSKVYLNNAYIGNTPLCKCEATTMLRNGDYTIKLVPLEQGLPEFQQKIAITKGVLTVVDRKFGKGATSEGSIISLTPLSDKKAVELLVVSIPDKSDVYIDTNNSGTTPLSLQDLTDSDHTIRLKRDGYKDKNVRIRTPVGYKLTATIYLGIKDGSTPVTTVTPTAVTTPGISGTGTPTPSPTTKATGKVIILETPNGFLRVRQQPSTTAAEITRVNTGQSFTLVEERTGWFKIALSNGTEGWVSTQYAQKQ